MFDFVAKRKRLVLVGLLVLILPPFALFGIETYFTGRDVGQAVARVGDHVISPDEFSRGLRDQLQRMTEGRVDPGTLDTPELRQATLEILIQRRLLIGRALQSGAVVPDQHLKGLISELPAFRDESGKFSFARYEQYLKSEGKTPAQFETSVRQDIMLQQFANGFGRSAFVPRTMVEHVSRLLEQQREVSLHVIEPERFLHEVKLDSGAAKLYYGANAGEFRTEEQVRVEYVSLSVDSLAQQTMVDPAEVKKYYEASRSQFGVQETRQVRHILVSVDAKAGPVAKEKARVAAEEIYPAIAKDPGGLRRCGQKALAGHRVCGQRGGPGAHQSRHAKGFAEFRGSGL